MNECVPFNDRTHLIAASTRQFLNLRLTHAWAKSPTEVPHFTTTKDER